MSETNDRTADTAGDELLVLRCQLGEAKAFDDLVERWHVPLWKYVRRMTGDQESAADTVQDIWLRVLRGISRLREPQRFRAWLFGIARRSLMDRLREKYRAPGFVVDEVPEAAPQEDANIMEEESALLNQALLLLPVIEREILTLFYLKELALTEVSEVLGVPVGTVKSRLFRAREMLRRQLQQKGMNP